MKSLRRFNCTVNVCKIEVEIEATYSVTDRGTSLQQIEVDGVRLINRHRATREYSFVNHVLAHEVADDIADRITKEAESAVVEKIEKFLLENPEVGDDEN